MAYNSGLWRWLQDVALGVEVRSLHADEVALVPAPLRQSIDINRVRLIGRAHNPLALRKILVRGHDIYWPRCPLDFTTASVSMQSLLVHELTHVWQYATGRLTAMRYLLRPKNWRYGYSVRRGARLDDYAIEAQADLVQDWFRMRCGHSPVHYRVEPPDLGWLEAVVDFSPPLLCRRV